MSDSAVPTLDELIALAEAAVTDAARDELIVQAENAVAEKVRETFAIVIPDLEEELPEEERRAELRRALGGRAPEWAVTLGVEKGVTAFEGETGELIRDAVTIAVFTDRGPVMRRLSKHLLEHGVDRFIALGLLHGWAQYYCAPTPFEGEIVGVFEEVLRDESAT